MGEDSCAIHSADKQTDSHTDATTVISVSNVTCPEGTSGVH